MSVTPPGHPSAPSECARIARSWTRVYTRPGVHEAAAPWPIFALLCVSILHGLASESEKKASASGVQPHGAPARPADGVSRLVMLPEHRICAYVCNARLPISDNLTKMTTIGIKRSTASVNIPRHARPPHSRASLYSLPSTVMHHVPSVHLSSTPPKGRL